MFHFKSNFCKTSFIKHIKEEQTDKIALTRKIQRREGNEKVNLKIEVSFCCLLSFLKKHLRQHYRRKLIMNKYGNIEKSLKSFHNNINTRKPTLFTI